MTRTVKKPAERRLEITETAQRLFLDKGYESTSLNDVIAELGVAKGTVYHYFKSKEELLDAVVQHMSTQYLKSIESKVSNDTGDAVHKLKNLTQNMNVSEQWKGKIQKLHLSSNMGLHVRLLGSLVRGLAPIMAAIIEQGCEEGVFNTLYPLEAAELLLSGLQFITDTGVYPWTEAELTRRVSAFPAIAEAQLGAKQGSLDFLM